MRPELASRSRQPAILVSAQPAATNQKPLQPSASTTTNTSGTKTGHSRRRGADPCWRIACAPQTRCRQAQPSPRNSKLVNTAFPRTDISPATQPLSIPALFRQIQCFVVMNDGSTEKIRSGYNEFGISRKFGVRSGYGRGTG